MADIFVVMDNVQYQKNGLQNRNKVRNSDGDFWLTIPVTGHLEDLIIDKRIANDAWRQKHWKSLKTSYSRAPYWSLYSAQIEQLYGHAYSTLLEANRAFLNFLLKALDITTKIVHLSDLKVDGSKSDLVLAICKALDATTYISGYGAENYMDEKPFSDASVEIRYVKSISPIYKQFNGSFIGDLSILDMLFNIEQSQIKKHFAGNAND